MREVSLRRRLARARPSDQRRDYFNVRGDAWKPRRLEYPLVRDDPMDPNQKRQIDAG